MAPLIDFRAGRPSWEVYMDLFVCRCTHEWKQQGTEESIAKIAKYNLYKSPPSSWTHAWSQQLIANDVLSVLATESFDIDFRDAIAEAAIKTLKGRHYSEWSRDCFKHNRLYTLRDPLIELAGWDPYTGQPWLCWAPNATRAEKIPWAKMTKGYPTVTTSGAICRSWRCWTAITQQATATFNTTPTT